MVNVRIEWNIPGFYDLRRDPGVIAELESIANDVAATASSMGDGRYEVGSRQGRRAPQGRWRTSVVTADAKAIAENAKHHILARAVGVS